MSSSPRQNNLADETSPYLQQHASNPVDWYPWGEEALQKAKQEDKPIFLSSGYSACHWCHVMAQESFENPEIAQLMNDWFINVKVDREERPDIDSVYMDALVALTGQGGWPLNVFLMPTGEPYFGGTYFPPTDQGNRPGFPQILKQTYELYRDHKEQVVKRSKKLLAKLVPEDIQVQSGLEVQSQWIEQSVHAMMESFDEKNGGFGMGMKFPEPMLQSLFLRYWVRTEAGEPLDAVNKTLTKMSQGGIFDQLGGGIHRYSTDRAWRVPHFEKMLYDNALVAKLYLEAYQAVKQEPFRQTAESILDYVMLEMQDAAGGFYSSQSADTDGEEGMYFVWDLKEVMNLLGPQNAKFFSKVYNMTPAGNFNRKNVLYLSDSIETLAEKENIPVSEFEAQLEVCRKTLLDQRKKRSAPFRDEKILASWNGLMIHAFAFGHSVLGKKEYLTAAKRAGNFVWDTMWKEGRLFRVFKDGQARVDGFLEDYVYLLESFIALYEASFDLVWIDRARELADVLLDRFWDKEGGGFFMTAHDQETLIHRPKPANDDAMPSPNASASLSLLKLGYLAGHQNYSEKGKQTLQAFRPQIEQQPTAHNSFLAVADFLLKPPTEIVFAGPKEDHEFAAMYRALFKDFRPNKILLYAGDGADEKLPLAEDKRALEGKPTAYLCQKQTCHAPVHTADNLAHLLERPPMIKLNIFDREKHIMDKTQEETANFLNVMDQIFKQSGLK